MIEFKNISKYYKYKKNTTKALDDVSFVVNNKDLVLISGPSGSGKTTLLNIVGGLSKQTSGMYLFNQEAIDGTDDDMAKFRAENIGFILQHFALINDRDVLYNIGLPLQYKGYKKNEIMERVNAVANSLGIFDKLKLYPNMLSGGECQRVAIARAIITNPKLILADEPTSSLDTSNKNEVLNILGKLNQKGITILITSHDNDVSSFCNKKIFLNKGKIAETNEV